MVSVTSLDSNLRSRASSHRVLNTQGDLTDWVSKLAKINNTDSYHMTPVRVIHARVQGDPPTWNNTHQMFTSPYGLTFDERFRGALDSMNTASVEGALMYVQAEGINYNGRGTKCERKNNMRNIVFFDLVITQTNETLALYGQENGEYGPYLAMDINQCTPTNGTSTPVEFPKACNQINGVNKEPKIGAYVGAAQKDTDSRAPYPDTWWYSFPNTCVQSARANKNDICRAATSRGLCDYDKLPDGITCTYNYRILGYVPIDDLVGITAMKNKANTGTYANFSEFCNDGGVEFNTTDNGTLIEAIDFWKDPLLSTANSARANKLVDTYNEILLTGGSPQAPGTVSNVMVPLPTIADLNAVNPACYLNTKACADAQFGCKRVLFGQICTVCASAEADCVTKPPNVTFPTLVKPVASTPGPSSPVPTSSSPVAPTPMTTVPVATTPATTTASAASIAVSVATAASAIALAFFMG
uniref:Uncharacterized protein n=1 Tax=Globisporangium ultimum (strain ATCC 200006 / CBS 805.95 / DAOM BR144) TaxID=431595 RepID=K3WLD3_GLOUD